MGRFATNQALVERDAERAHRIAVEQERESLRNENRDLRAQVAEPEAWLDRVMRKRVVVHTKDDQSVDGTLMLTTADGLILRSAKLLNSSGPDTTMAGEVFVFRENVAFIQLDE